MGPHTNEMFPREPPCRTLAYRRIGLRALALHTDENDDLWRIFHRQFFGHPMHLILTPHLCIQQISLPIKLEFIPNNNQNVKSVKMITYCLYNYLLMGLTSSLFVHAWNCCAQTCYRKWLTGARPPILGWQSQPVNRSSLILWPKTPPPETVVVGNAAILRHKVVAAAHCKTDSSLGNSSVLPRDFPNPSIHTRSHGNHRMMTAERLVGGVRYGRLKYGHRPLQDI